MASQRLVLPKGNLFIPLLSKRTEVTVNKKAFLAYALPLYFLPFYDQVHTPAPLLLIMYRFAQAQLYPRVQHRLLRRVETFTLH